MELQYTRISTLGERLFALIIDHIIMTFFGVSVMTGIMLNFFTGSGPTLPFVTLLAIFMIYMLKDIIGGRSIGKRVFSIGVRCLEDPGEIPSLGRLILRNFTLLIWPVEFLILLFSTSGRRLGDIIAKTAVVKLDRDIDNEQAVMAYHSAYKNRKPITRKKQIKTLVIAIVLVVGLLTVIVGGALTILKTSDAYKTAITAIEHNEAILSQTGTIEGYGFVPEGSLSTTNGYGEAEYLITVKGQKNTSKVYVRLSKQPKVNWQSEFIGITQP